MSNLEYTEMQLKIISGEIPMETVDGRTLRWLHGKAIARNDLNLAEQVKTRLSYLKTIAAEKNRQRFNTRYKQKRLGGFQWKQPQSNEYTEHQKQIVRGEIPYEDVHTNELISIHLKAHNIGDYELSERVLDLINTRRQEATKRHDVYTKIRHKSKGYAAFKSDESIKFLAKWEQAVLMGYVDLDECSEEQLQHIIDAVQKHGDTEMITIAKQLMLYKTEPEVLYAVHEHREAIDMIERLLGLPIRRPETWFIEDE